MMHDTIANFNSNELNDNEFCSSVQKSTTKWDQPFDLFHTDKLPHAFIQPTNKEIILHGQWL